MTALALPVKNHSKVRYDELPGRSLMTLIYWDWHLIPKWLLKWIFSIGFYSSFSKAWYLLKKSWRVFIIECSLRDAFGYCLASLGVMFCRNISIVNEGDCWCFVHDLETIIVLVLLAFNVIPQRSHHSLTFPRSRFKDSGTANLINAWGWHNSFQVESSASPLSLFYGMEKGSELYWRNNYGPTTLSYGILDSALTSLLRQRSTMACCDQFDRNCVRTDNTEPPTPTALKSIWTILASCPLSRALCKVCATHKRASQVPRPFL